MLEKKDRIVHLISNSLRDNLSQEEYRELEQWLSENEEHRKLYSQLTNDDTLVKKMGLYQRSEIPDGWNKVQQLMNGKSTEWKKKHSELENTLPLVDDPYVDEQIMLSAVVTEIENLPEQRKKILKMNIDRLTTGEIKKKKFSLKWLIRAAAFLFNRNK